VLLLLLLMVVMMMMMPIEISILIPTAASLLIFFSAPLTCLLPDGIPPLILFAHSKPYSGC